MKRIKYKFRANDSTGYWEVHDDAGFVCDTESESTARLFCYSSDMYDALLALTHPMAGEDDLEYALEVINNVKGNNL
jgi:hypothetical protein